MDEAAVLKLISGGVDKSIPQQAWLDLGAGSGTFTMVLAGLLDNESIVYAIDKDKRSLSKIVIPPKGAKIVLMAENFLNENFQIHQAHGIIMANSLHYVKDQFSFLKKIKDSLLDNGRLIIVEYDRMTSNQWVPFPISFEQLQKLGRQAGFEKVIKLGEQSSTYGGGMYGALVK